MTTAQNLVELDQEQALYLGKFFIRSNQNLFLFGRRGTGKSAIAMQAAQACKMKINYINLSVVERCDLAGFPNIHEQSDVVSFKSPAFLPLLKDKTKPDSILLFDEVDKAPPEITAPLLEILQFRKINGKPINAAACILTGNLANEGTYSNSISTALLDRGAKFILSFNFEKWLEWGRTNGVHDLILGFLQSNPELACGDIEDTRYASPSPRAWTLASESLIKANDFKITDIETVIQIISGYVGGEAGLKFRMWYEYYRKFETFVHSLIERGTMALDFDQLMPTEKLIFVVGACHYAKQKIVAERGKNKCLYLDNLCSFFKASKVEKEMQVIALHNSFPFDFIAKMKLYECQAFFEHFNGLNEGVVFKK